MGKAIDGWRNWHLYRRQLSLACQLKTFLYVQNSLVSTETKGAFPVSKTIHHCAMRRFMSLSETSEGLRLILKVYLHHSSHHVKFPTFVITWTGRHVFHLSASVSPHLLVCILAAVHSPSCVGSSSLASVTGPEIFSSCIVTSICIFWILRDSVAILYCCLWGFCFVLGPQTLPVTHTFGVLSECQFPTLYYLDFSELFNSLFWQLALYTCLHATSPFFKGKMVDPI